MNSELLVMIPDFLSVQIGIANHNLIPELFVVPVSLHFSEHFHQLILSPVDKFKMVIVALEDFKDHVVELNVVSSIAPLLDGIISILFHFNKDLNSFIWEANFIRSLL